MQELQWKATQGILSYSKSLALTALEGATKVTTDAQGLANASISAGSYKVVVLLDNDYKELDLTVVDEQVKEATISDLNPAAISLARNNSKNKYPDMAEEVEIWDDITFLNKAKLTIKGKITRTALILLGESEAEHFLSPADIKIRWKLVNRDN